jgi:hypothetical protein
LAYLGCVAHKYKTRLEKRNSLLHFEKVTSLHGFVVLALKGLSNLLCVFGFSKSYNNNNDNITATTATTTRPWSEVTKLFTAVISELC